MSEEKSNLALLTCEENAVLDDLVAAWNKFIKLEVLHPDHLNDFKDAIHTAQRLVMVRPVSREVKQIRDYVGVRQPDRSI